MNYSLYSNLLTHILFHNYRQNADNIFDGCTDMQPKFAWFYHPAICFIAVKSHIRHFHF